MAKTGFSALLQLQPFEEGEDPDRAPVAYAGEGARRPGTPRRALQNRLPIFLAGLLFLVLSLAGLFREADTLLGVLLRCGWLLLYALWYAGSALAADLRLRGRWLYLAGFLGLHVVIAPVLGWYVFYLSVYVSIMIGCLLPWRQSRWAIPAWSVITIAVCLISGEWIMLTIAVLGLLVGWGTAGGIETGRLSDKLDRSRQRNAVLAVAAERERIGRDLHDILGHSLTAIAIKTDLAQRLVDVDPAAAKAQLAEVEQVARQALADVRTTASGIRQVRLATEIASGRSVLIAAGIQPAAPTTVPPMADATSELLGYVVREAITNTVRHADATSVVITVGPDWVQVADDGRGITEVDHTGGSGLAGLRSRLVAAGGVLVVQRNVPAGTIVRGTVGTQATAPGVRTAGPAAEVLS